MGMKLNAAGLTARLGKRYAGLVNPGVSHVEVGVADASICLLYTSDAADE